MKGAEVQEELHLEENKIQTRFWVRQGQEESRIRFDYHLDE